MNSQNPQTTDTQEPAMGQILPIDKPVHWTSFDVVKKIRGLLKMKKVGHAGTLDPLATGLLIVCTGRKTKEIEKLMDLDKTYTGIIEIGKTTPSYDLETEFDTEHPWQHISPSDCETAAQELSGDISQIPPTYSAVRIEGKRAYEKARAGEKPKLGPRHVTIRSFSVDASQLPEVRFEVTCTKGTYIRSLASDFGKALGCGAYLKQLRRTRIGDFKVEDALTIDDVIENAGLPGN